MVRNKGVFKMLTLGSLFDGIGGWQLAGIRNGIKPIWSAEIEPFPIAVTKEHFPETIQLGDVTKIDGSKIPAVDIICMGSPCQDLSVAKSDREGLQGEKSGLFFEAIRIVRQMRMSSGGVYPKVCILENVQECLQATKEWISVLYWHHIQTPKFQCLLVDDGRTQDWLEADDVMLHGEASILNVTSHNEGKESSLSAILQKTGVHPKYFLSKNACEGILKRSRKRNQPLPPELMETLLKQVGATNHTHLVDGEDVLKHPPCVLPGETMVEDQKPLWKTMDTSEG